MNVLNNTAAVTITFTKSNGFTYCEDLTAWCVLRGLKSETIKKNKKLLQSLNGSSLTDLMDSGRLLECVTRLLNVELHSNRSRNKYLSIFITDGAVLAPMASPKLGSSQTNNLIPEGILERLLQTTKENCGITNISSDEVFALGKLWTSTKEGREVEITADILRNFVKLYYRESKFGPDQYTYKEGVSSRHAAAIKYLAGKLEMTAEIKRQTRTPSPEHFVKVFPEGRKWVDYFDEFCRQKLYGAVEKVEYSFKNFCEYLSQNPDLVSPEKFFSRDVPRKKLLDWFVETGRKSIEKDIRFLRSFFVWIVGTDETIGVRDPITGDIMVRSECFVPITESDISSISTAYLRPAETVQLALPLEYLDEVDRILTDNDMEWPKSCKNEWATLRDPESGEYKNVFCPVMPNLVRILIKLPLRQVQARRLDSGEGDELKFDLEQMEFVKNVGPFAGYWKIKGVKNPQRGVLRKVVDTWTGASLCGFYINTNKITDRKHGFDENSGYVISWQNEYVIQIIQEMRAWQEYWNPVQGPTKYVDVRPGTFPKMQKDAAKRRPDIFYLFRYPAGQEHSFAASPPSDNALRFFWFKVLAELERRLKERGENPPELIYSWNYETPTASAYTLHGLRHAGLTRMAEAGVHPWILKNIVAGHADYVMTLYYIKPKPTHISAHLTEKYEEAMRNKQDEFLHFLASKTLEEVHRLAIAGSNDAFTSLQQLKASVRNPAAAMSKLDHGVCPNGRTRCHEGARLDAKKAVNKRGSKLSTAPTPTIMGVPDCTRCRFWITGTPFVEGLRIKTNEVSFACHKAAVRHRDMIKDLNNLEAERYRLEKSGLTLSSSLQRKLMMLRQEVKTEGEIVSELGISLDNHGKKWEEVRALLRIQAKSNDSNKAYLLYEEEPQFEWGLVPRFEAIDELAHSAKWFTSVRTEDINRERRENVVQMLVRQNKPPAIAIMSHQEADAAINACTARLYSQLNKQAVNRLFSGQETFESLGITTDPDSVMAQLISTDLQIISTIKPMVCVGFEE